MVQQELLGEQSQESWVVWPGRCPTSSQESEVDLANAGIIRIKDDGAEAYKVVDRVPFRDFPRRFVLEASDALGRLQDDYATVTSIITLPLIAPTTPLSERPITDNTTWRGGHGLR